MQQTGVVEQFIAERFPGVLIALVAGSTATGKRTPTSDIDMLLIGEEMLPPGVPSLAATYEYRGEIFEVFAYTREGFDNWARTGLSQYRPFIVNMLLEGAPIRGGLALSELRAYWRSIYDAGPVVSAHDLALRRYAVTDLLDDLRDASDPVERHVVAFTLFERTAELILLDGGRWIGTGKYLPRRLRELSLERADALTQPLIDGDLNTFGDRVEEELRSAGGRVQAGFVR